MPGCTFVFFSAALKPDKPAQPAKRRRSQRHLTKRATGAMSGKTIATLGNVQGLLIDLEGNAEHQSESRNRYVFEVENPGIKTLLEACTERVDRSNVYKVSVYLDEGDIGAVTQESLPDPYRQLLARVDVDKYRHYTLDLRKLLPRAT